MVRIFDARASAAAAQAAENSFLLAGKTFASLSDFRFFAGSTAKYAKITKESLGNNLLKFVNEKRLGRNMGTLRDLQDKLTYRDLDIIAKRFGLAFGYTDTSIIKMVAASADDVAVTFSVDTPNGVRTLFSYRQMGPGQKQKNPTLQEYADAIYESMKPQNANSVSWDNFKAFVEKYNEYELEGYSLPGSVKLVPPGSMRDYFNYRGRLDEESVN